MINRLYKIFINSGVERALEHSSAFFIDTTDF